MRRRRFPQKRADGYRSGLEASLGEQLRARGEDYEYESLLVPYTQPAKERRYRPDFVLANGIIIEAKGQFTSADRQKHLMVRECWPGLDIRFVFSRSGSRLSKASKTTYATWCGSKGFLFHDRIIPAMWLREPPNEDSLAALEEIRGHRLNRRR